MAVRCLHEASLHDGNSFVTLTYSDEALERFAEEGGNPYSLHYPHFQDFMKRVRFHCGPTRFFMCGEYGEQFGRPHFHALLFGREFPDRKVFKRLSNGQTLFSSDELDSLWGHGFTSIGAVTMESAQYVARYAQKSLVPGHENWKRRDSTRYAVDPETGECHFQVPEFIRMSNGGGKATGSGGIGAAWFKRYGADVFGVQAEPALDRVVVNGAAAKPPKYYDTLLGRESEYRLEYVKFVRELDALRRGDSELTPARLLQREAVARARLMLKKRGL